MLVPLAMHEAAAATDRSARTAAQAATRPAPRALQTSASPDQQLADRYAPVVYLRQVNNDICNTENEGFDPIPVDFVLGREEIPFIVSENGSPTGR